ncbi:MAG: ABC transporter permease [Bacteroidales bacterium]|nr:ABC transporter permease [Bacteroidales bacterium]
MNGQVIENIRVSLNSIRSHFLRTILTVLIIAFGIMALVGILTAIDSIKFYLNENFTRMGANTLTIKNRTLRMHQGGGVRSENYRNIDFDEAVEFTKSFDFPASTSLYAYATRTATLKYGTEKTNPNIPVLGTDDNYLSTSGNKLTEGRNFSPSELSLGANVAIIGSRVADDLFGKSLGVTGKEISLAGKQFTVIGVLESKGTGMGFSNDRLCIIPIQNLRETFPQSNLNFSINIMPEKPALLDDAIGEATGLFRVIRKLKLSEENNFEVAKSDNLARMLFENLKYLRMAATIIGLITLVGAAIGLMNIMLVSVTERTREIGIRKAIGAKRKTIRWQFLMESITIAQIGGILGIILGILIGNVLSLIIGSSFVVPWIWIIGGLLLCFAVALLSGIIPANKAARLDPIESLRYE